MFNTHKCLGAGQEIRGMGSQSWVPHHFHGTSFISFNDLHAGKLVDGVKKPTPPQTNRPAKAGKQPFGYAKSHQADMDGDRNYEDMP